ncbi:MAG: cytochrome P450 [Gemmatimonadaceae bacterium]
MMDSPAADRGVDTIPARQPAVRRPPGPRARYPGEMIRALASDRLDLFDRMRRHGDVTEISIASQRIVLVMHPDDIRRVLVSHQRGFERGPALERAKAFLGEGLLTSEGELHMRQRRLVQPAFHRASIAAHAGLMAGIAEHVVERWADGTLVDAHAEMMRLTLAVAGRAFFDADVEGDARDVAEALELSLRMHSYALLPFGTLLEHVPLRWVRELRRARLRMDGIIYRLIAERRAHPGERSDVLSLLIAARDAEGDGTGMSDRQLRDEVVTLLMAGHETTANALTWTWYLLSRHPSVELRLHDEVDRVLGGRAPTMDDLPRLEYTRRVLSESMRLYPPAWTLERRAVEDIVIGGHRVSRGTVVLACQYLVHRDPRWWEDPERFDPDRWDPQLVALRPKFSYFPFGAGSRMCVGEQFAWMEATLVLATIARRWRLRHESPHAPEPEPQITLRPRGGLAMRVMKR